MEKWEKDALEKLRKEQRPDPFKPLELELPLPSPPEEDWRPIPPEEEKEPSRERGVWEIDLI